MEEEWFDTLRKLWNAKTPYHISSDFYDVPSFLEGKNTLNPLELTELGDVKGKSLLHLQCHFGMDTLSWSRLGAQVTGVDISDESIKEAERLAKETQLEGRFITSNVITLDEVLDEEFDIVFTSYGAIPWIPDLKVWARIIEKFVKPGGCFYIAEHHPILDSMDDDFTEFVDSFEHNPQPADFETDSTYADKDAKIDIPVLWWRHPLSEVINVLLEVGLRIEFVHEFPYVFYDCFPNFVKCKDGFYRWKEDKDTIPLMFSIKAWKDK